jgi:hypothetical protein
VGGGNDPPTRRASYQSQSISSWTKTLLGGTPCLRRWWNITSSYENSSVLWWEIG